MSHEKRVVLVCRCGNRRADQCFFEKWEPCALCGSCAQDMIRDEEEWVSDFRWWNPFSLFSGHYQPLKRRLRSVSETFGAYVNRCGRSSE